MSVALTQIPIKSGTDFHIIVLIRAMFVLSVLNTVAGVSDLSGRAAAFFTQISTDLGGLSHYCAYLCHVCVICVFYIVQCCRGFIESLCCLCVGRSFC